jgi:Peptidase A4 family
MLPAMREPAGRTARTVLAVTGVTLTGLLGAASAAAGATTSATSTNWAGYVARPAASAGSRGFTSVSGSWVEPAATCKTGREAYSAVWVGLGGYKADASTLEQIGTDADCTRSGRARYSSWVELLPAAPTALKVATRPGDQMTASVTIIGSHATLRLRNLTTGESYSATKALSHIDVSSAEWIVEAPSVCERSCGTLPLADFSSVSFTAATATAAGRTSGIAAGGWPLTRLYLRQGLSEAASPARFGRGVATALISATPSAASATGAFSVLFAEQAGAEAPSAPTLPGFGGVPPGA